MRSIHCTVRRWLHIQHSPPLQSISVYSNCDNVHTQYITRFYSFRSHSHLTFPWQLCGCNVSRVFFFTSLFSLCSSSVNIIVLYMPLYCWSLVLWYFLCLLWPNIIWFFFIVLLHRVYFRMIHMLAQRPFIPFLLAWLRMKQRWTVIYSLLTPLSNFQTHSARSVLPYVIKWCMCVCFDFFSSTAAIIYLQWCVGVI